jgi:hypothetical protein
MAFALNQLLKSFPSFHAANCICQFKPLFFVARMINVARIIRW